MKYARLFTNSEGVSSFSEEYVTFSAKEFAPPLPPLPISAFTDQKRLGFLDLPALSDFGWHPAPARQFMVLLQGRVDIVAGTGEVQHFEPGALLLLEDTIGQGHQTKVTSADDAIFAVIQ